MIRTTKFAVAALAAVTAAATMTGASPGNAGSGRLPARWVGAWSTSPAVPGPANPAFTGFTDQSIRMVVRTSISGESVRVRVSNAFGAGHLSLTHASVALPNAATPADRTDVRAGSVRELTFSGSAAVVVPRGAQLLSDQVALAVPALSELVVTLYFRNATGVPTFHNISASDSYVGAGDLTSTPAGTGFTIVRSHFYFLTDVEVLTRRSIGSIVVIGDSLADGAGSVLNANKRWPDQLADRLIAEHPFGPYELGVLNGGIAGNHVTAHDGAEVGGPGFGVNALARLDRDAFGKAGVRLVFVCLGFNDIELSDETAENIIASLKQAALQIRAQGLVAIGCTLTPVEGFVRHTPEHEVTRQAVNRYLLTTRDFHAVVDFDAVVRDPAHPTQLRPDIDSGDHIHPDNIGYRMMVDAIPLRLLG